MESRLYLKLLNLETRIQTLAEAEGRGMRRREIGQMEPLGKGQACIYEAKGRQYGREGEDPKACGVGVTQSERP